MKHYAAWIHEAFLRLFKLKTGDMPDSQVEPTITPVIEVKPYTTTYDVAITNGSATILTTKANHDTYLLGVQLSTMQDATSPNIVSYIQYVQNGLNKRALIHNFVAGIAAFQSSSRDFSKAPILVDAGTTIAIGVNSGAAGTTYSGASVWLMEVPR